ncbi:hypothetical protein POM88_030562 [Heracleum sosnowskyi]|uniref:DNA-directed RNA polymerase n=1 Tax=Heracleum sosnowskyi TaxID=360622 RepID=A0AAD8HX35_9APIA|nr:hypothetical protein POM88_030562 [Heracleum sosnowskyi]
MMRRTIYSEALCARNLVNQVDKKLVKQTVTTSVFGVTYIGARDQIKKRLKECGSIADDTELFRAAYYAAEVTLTAHDEMFEAVLAFGHLLSAVRPRLLETLLFPSALSGNFSTIIQEEVIASKLEEEAFVTG